MIKVKSSQKIFTDTETATLTGIGLERLYRLASARHLGFIARGAASGGQQTEQWLFYAFRPRSTLAARPNEPRSAPRNYACPSRHI